MDVNIKRAIKANILPDFKMVEPIDLSLCKKLEKEYLKNDESQK